MRFNVLPSKRERIAPLHREIAASMMKLLDRRALIRIVLLTGALASPASGAQAALTSQDSAEIWVGVIRILLDTLYSGSTPIPVLWVAPPRTLDSAKRSAAAVVPSKREPLLDASLVLRLSI
jgi:hypothetical protein